MVPLKKRPRRANFYKFKLGCEAFYLKADPSNPLRVTNQEFTVLNIIKIDIRKTIGRFSFPVFTGLLILLLKILLMSF